MKGSRAEPGPQALGLPNAPTPTPAHPFTSHPSPLPSHQNWPWPHLHLPPGLAAPLPPQPPALSILRPWPPVSHGFFLSWWSWPVMTMNCYFLALGSSSLEGGMGPVWLIGSNITKSMTMLLIIIFNICKFPKIFLQHFSYSNLITIL